MNYQLHHSVNVVIDIVLKEGTTLLNKLFVGYSATDVVCEGTSPRRYLGHCSNLITPLWVLRTTKEKEMQRFVNLSADLARQLESLLDNCEIGVTKKATKENGYMAREQQSYSSKLNLEERQQIVEFTKNGVRDRLCRKMQTSDSD